MTAKVTIIDDNGIPKGVYELAPSRTYENGISTKYVFEFEYNQLNKERDYEVECRNHSEMLLQKSKIGHCKDCKYFEYNSKIDGLPFIVAHKICSRWGDGCMTKENGYCFLFEPQESEG